MALPEVFRRQLAPLAHNLGGYDKLDKIPTNTLIAAACHGDAVIGVSNLSYLFELSDITGDYEVFNRRLESRYVASPSVDKLWGTNEPDQVYLAQVLPGEYFYIAYTNNLGVDRLILVVRA